MDRTDALKRLMSPRSEDGEAKRPRAEQQTEEVVVVETIVGVAPTTPPPCTAVTPSEEASASQLPQTTALLPAPESDAPVTMPVEPPNVSQEPPTVFTHTTADVQAQPEPVPTAPAQCGQDTTDTKGTNLPVPFPRRSEIEFELFGECSDMEEEGPATEPARILGQITVKSEPVQNEATLVTTLQEMTQELRKCSQFLGDLVKGQQEILGYARRTARALETTRPTPPPSSSQTSSQKAKSRSRSSRH